MNQLIIFRKCDVIYQLLAEIPGFAREIKENTNNITKSSWVTFIYHETMLSFLECPSQAP